ncbi:MAG TPA: hypothetical protein VF765_12120 [Polyangiaceae bacterium]
MRDVRSAPGALKLALGPRAPAPAARMASIVAALLVAAAIALALVLPFAVWMRAGVALALVAGAAAAHHLLSRRMQPPHGWLVLDAQTIRRVEPGRESKLVALREPFGVTVLARSDRSAFVLALTSPAATRFVPVRVEKEGDLAEARMLAEKATTAPESDLPVDEAMSLSARDADRLLRALAARLPAVLERVYLFDADGDPVVLDRTELRVGSRRIDLASPLEWRPFVFQETGAHVSSLCQATWVRQGEAEVVLVSPMAGDTRNTKCAPDARLMQASPGEPPPRDQRRAIDRLFMLPLRKALDGAPRISRVPSSPSQPTTEGRA